MLTLHILFLPKICSVTSQKSTRVCDAYKLRGIKLLNAQCAFNTEFALGKRLPLTKASFGAGSYAAHKLRQKAKRVCERIPLSFGALNQALRETLQ